MILLLVAPARAFEPLAAGVDDATAMVEGVETPPSTSRFEVGAARPWGDLDVHTDWARAVGTLGAGHGGLALARVRAGTVSSTVIEPSAGWVFHRGSVAVSWRRTSTAVGDLDVVDTHAIAFTARTSVGGVATALTAIRDPRLRSRWATRVVRGAFRARVVRSDRRFDPAATWIVAAEVGIHEALDVGVRVESADTLWSMAAHRGRWRLAVGRVVDGPRAGASALSLQLRP